MKTGAKLSQLRFDDQQIESFKQDLNNIIHMVEKMNNANIDNVEPLAHPLDAKQRLREDTVTETDEREAYQRYAPEVRAGLYLVPKFVDVEPTE